VTTFCDCAFCNPECAAQSLLARYSSWLLLWIRDPDRLKLSHDPYTYNDPAIQDAIRTVQHLEVGTATATAKATASTKVARRITGWR
jgi:hypothetical protein